MSIGRLLDNWTSDLLDRVGLSSAKPYLDDFTSTGRSAAETHGWQTAISHLTARINSTETPAPVETSSPQDLQSEAAKLIADHTSYFNLDEDGLGRNLAGRVGERPELVRAVYAQLGAGDRVQVARTMVAGLSDDRLRDMVWSEDGRALLHDINRWVANNSLTGDGRSHTQTDRA